MPSVRSCCGWRLPRLVLPCQTSSAMHKRSLPPCLQCFVVNLVQVREARAVLMQHWLMNCGSACAGTLAAGDDMADGASGGAAMAGGVRRQGPLTGGLRRHHRQDRGAARTAGGNLAVLRYRYDAIHFFFVVPCTCSPTLCSVGLSLIPHSRPCSSSPVELHAQNVRATCLSLEWTS